MTKPISEDKKIIIRCVTLTRATGYWGNVQSGIVRSFGSVIGHVVGNSSATGAVVNHQDNRNDYHTDPFDYNFSFVHVVDSPPFAMVGVTMECSWKRGTGNWNQFSFSNNYTNF